MGPCGNIHNPHTVAKFTTVVVVLVVVLVVVVVVEVAVVVPGNIHIQLENILQRSTH